MKSQFILWASYKGVKVYTDKNRSFSFTENIIDQVSKVLQRGFPIEKENGESFKEEIVKLNNVNGNTFFIGDHRIYTEVKIN